MVDILNKLKEMVKGRPKTQQRKEEGERSPEDTSSKEQVKNKPNMTGSKEEEGERSRNPKLKGVLYFMGIIIFFIMISRKYCFFEWDSLNIGFNMRCVIKNIN